MGTHLEIGSLRSYVSQESQGEILLESRWSLNPTPGILIEKGRVCKQEERSSNRRDALKAKGTKGNWPHPELAGQARRWILCQRSQDVAMLRSLGIGFVYQGRRLPVVLISLVIGCGGAKSPKLHHDTHIQQKMLIMQDETLPEPLHTSSFQIL